MSFKTVNKTVEDGGKNKKGKRKQHPHKQIPVLEEQQQKTI